MWQVKLPSCEVQQDANYSMLRYYTLQKRHDTMYPSPNNMVLSAALCYARDRST